MSAAPITDERLAEVRQRFDAIERAEPDSLTGHIKGLLARLDIAERATPHATPVQPTASVEAVARIDAMGVQPERSDTFHYQAAGYSQGWHAAIAAYRQGIRKLASLTPAPMQGDRGLKLEISKEWFEQKAKAEGDLEVGAGAPEVCPECKGKGEVRGKHTFGKGWEMATCPRCLGNGSTKHAELMALLDTTRTPSPVSAPSPAGGVREALEDKIEGLEADLDSAVEVAFKHGAVEWTRLNYPKHYERLSEPVSAPAGEVVKRARDVWAEADLADTQEEAIAIIAAALSNPAPGHGEGSR